jgi:hypothetical protein
MWGAAGQVEALQLSAAAQIPSQPLTGSQVECGRCVDTGGNTIRHARSQTCTQHPSSIPGPSRGRRVHPPPPPSPPPAAAIALHVGVDSAWRVVAVKHGLQGVRRWPGQEEGIGGALAWAGVPLV